MKFEIKITDRDVYEDSYEHGEGDHISSHGQYLFFSSDNIEEIKEKLVEIGAEMDEDDVYYSFTTTELEDGTEPTDRELELFKEGKLKLFSVHHVAIVQVTQTITDDLVTRPNLRNKAYRI